MSHPNPSTALGRVVVDELVRNGVAHLVLAPGSRSSPLAMAAPSQPGMTVHVVLDERSAGFLALGMAKASGLPSAVVTTSGTAAANLHPAAVEADLSRTPLLLLTADRPPELREVGANQTIDQVRLFGNSVRWFHEVGVPEDADHSNPYWRSTVCRAVAEASGRHGPPGPVHLDLAFREPLVPLADDGRSRSAQFLSPTEGRPEGAPWTTFDRPIQGGVSPSGLPAVARRPLIVAGSSFPGLVASAREAGVPVVAEGPSGARLPGTVSTAHHLLGHPRFLERYLPDLVVTVGRVGLSPHLTRMLGTVERHVAVDPVGWPDPERTAARMASAVELGGMEPETGWRERWDRVEATARAALDAFLDSLEEPAEPRTARDVSQALPEGGTLVVASSMPVRDVDWFMPAHGIGVVANRGASGIDGFVSTALGVAAAGEGPVVALAGDLSLLHDGNGFLVEPRPDCVFVVANNDGGGIFSFLPQARFPEVFEQAFGTPHHRDLAVLARLHGLRHRLLARAPDLGDEVRAALAAGGIGLVEVRTDRATNVSIHRQATEAVHRAIDPLL